MLREKPVFTTPNVFPPPSSSRPRSTARAGVPRARRAAALLRLQAALLERPSLLRPALPRLRRLQLRQAHRDGRPARPRRAAHRRARQDRLPGRDQAAAGRRAADRHHALPARRGGALRGGARLRRLGRPAGDLRARPAAHAERRGLLRAPADDARPARLHRQQRLPDGAPAAGVLPPHAGARDRVGRADARAAAAPARRVRGTAPRRHPRGRRAGGARAHRRHRVVRRALAGAAPARGRDRRRRPLPRGPARPGPAAGRPARAATRGGCCSTRSRRSSCSRRSS